MNLLLPCMPPRPSSQFCYEGCQLQQPSAPPPPTTRRTYFRDFSIAAKINNMKPSHLTRLGQQSHRIPQCVGACLTRLEEELIHTNHISSTYLEKWDCVRDGVHKTHLQPSVTCRIYSCNASVTYSCALLGISAKPCWE